MGLELWCPYTKDLNNYGLSGDLIGQPEYVEKPVPDMISGGKIGTMAASGNGGSRTIVYNLPTFTDIQEIINGFTLSFWIYATQDDANSNTDRLALRLNGVMVLYAYLNSNELSLVGNSIRYSYPIEINTWNHVCVIFKFDPLPESSLPLTHVLRTYVYLNNTYKISGGGVTTIPEDLCLNKTRDFLVRSNRTKLNDVRFYNHAISESERLDIYRGLVSHYKLDSFGADQVAAHKNDLVNAGKYQSFTHTSSKTDGSKVYPLYANGLDTNTTYTIWFWCNGSISSSHSSDRGTPADKKFTIFIYSDTVEYTDSDYTHYTTATNFNSSTSGYMNSGELYGWSFKPKHPNICFRFNSYSDGTTPVSILIQTPKLEKGSRMTGWLPNYRDEKYGENELNVAFDCSGNKNNGTLHGDFDWWPTGLTQEASSLVFNGQNTYIDLGRSSMVTDEITVSCWAYMTPSWVTTDGSTVRLLSCTETGGISLQHYSNGTINFLVYANGAYRKGYWSTPLTVGMHHFVGTWDGYTAKIYVDGVCGTSDASLTTKYPIKYNSKNSILIGAEPGGSNVPASTPCYFTGYMQNVRIYGTALNQDDVNYLYKVRDAINQEGEVWSEVFKDNTVYNNVNFSRFGGVRGNTISELDTKFDNTVYEESDGSKWIRIFHHNNPKGGVFSSSSPFSTGIYESADRWFNVGVCNSCSKYELLIVQASTTGATPQRFRWKQDTNPMEGSFSEVAPANITKITSGYNTSSSSYGGIYKLNNGAYIVANNGTDGNWFGAIGEFSTGYNSSSLPGYNGVAITTGYLDLYIRIDNQPSGLAPDKTYIQGNSIYSKRFIEM